MYIERIRRKHRDKTYVTTLIRESYRDGKKVKHRTVANISRLPESTITTIEMHLNNVPINSCAAENISINKSREYGASKAFMDLAISLGLDKIIYSRKEDWRQDVLAMAVGRLVYQGSKLHLCHLHQDTFIWEATGYTDKKIPEVDKHCYCVLDKLLLRQKSIQKELANRHLDNGSLVLYDITSTYLEGEYENSELVDFGYSRDCKRKHEQIVIGLLANSQGCPIAIEVFRGNTLDQTTVLDQAKKVADMYKVKNVIFVGDRGMLTPKRIDEVSGLGYKTLTAVDRKQLLELQKSGVISPEQFDETEIIEVPNKGVRYFLCKNPEKEQENKETRQALIRRTYTELMKVAVSKNKDEHKKSARIGRILAQYKVGKFFIWSFQNGKLSVQIDQEKIAAEERWDGCYAIRTDSTLTKEEAVANYKALAHIERAFRNMKTMSLEIRPVYHHLDDRIRAHVFLCMLAYYLEWHATRRLQPLFVKNGRGAQRRFTFARIIERLKSIRIQDCVFGSVTVSGIVTTPDKEQQEIIDLLKSSQNSEI